MRIGSLNRMVTLDDPVEDGTPVVFWPNRVPVAIAPAPPGAFDETKVTHQVTMRYHPQVTYNTRLTFEDARGAEHHLYVRGVQNIDMADEELVLLCEEVLTP